MCNFGKKSIPEIHCESRGLLLFVVPNPDEVARLGEGVPGDMEPAGAGEELVCVLTTAQEVDQALELLRVAGADVGGAALKPLRLNDGFTVDGYALEVAGEIREALKGLVGE